MTRWLPALILCLAVGGTACADDITGPGSQTQQSATGTLTFRLDPATCVGTGTLELYVDGVSQGQYVFNPGNFRSFTVSAGSHTAGAQQVGGNQWSWSPQTVTVPANGTMTELLTC